MLRKRSMRKYDETEPADDEIEAERRYDLEAPLNSERFGESTREKYLQILQGEAIVLRYIQKNGFDKPILVETPKGLNLRAPESSFLVRDVRDYVGPNRLIDVMDVKTQKNIEMTMKDWCKYYESRNRVKLLNVISLEFSHTKLDKLVDSPMIIKSLDWVDLVWPKHLKQSQTESTNTIQKMKYPKVQKYCLMSVRGSYTDFHIDFGGTSVWYHILKGRKIFWMVPPTELNLQIFEEWTLSGQQHDIFFGDTVEECFRVELKAPNTFFIPSGWIHAVYTLEDSLVFGGNFLHSFGIERQLKIARLEDSTKVPIKFRYPFYTEILWYVVQHYVHCLTGKSHINQDVLAAQLASMSECHDEEANDDSNNNHDNNNNDDDDESDDTVETESDNKPTAVKRKRGRPSKNSKKFATTASSAAILKSSSKTAAKTKRKPSPPPTDDESTDIDSGNESAQAKTEQPSTCRMTKNSLSRLQYEIDSLQREAKKDKEKSKESPNKTTQSKNSSIISNKTKEHQSNQQSRKKQLLHDGKDLSSSSSQIKSSVTSAAAAADFAEMLSRDAKVNGWSNQPWSAVANSKEPQKVHLTTYELNGLKALVKHLSKLTGARKNMPSLIKNSKSLLDDCKKLIAEHEKDDQELAITGKPINEEILSKKNDMNELICQFFKQDGTVIGDDNKEKKCQTGTESTVKAKLSSKSGDESVEHRFKKIKTEFNGKQDEPGFSPGDTLSSLVSSSAHAKQASIKETKCLTSPMKKDKFFSTSSSPFLNSPSSTTVALTAPATYTQPNAASSLSESPPPKPPSPPTRPLSNNQYCSKTTKKFNNMLLPGSFAGLIAATSSEKKAFDVVSPDESSSLFPSLLPLKVGAASSRSTYVALATDRPGSRSSRESRSSDISLSPVKSFNSSTRDPQFVPQKQISAKSKEEPQQHPKSASPTPPKVSATPKRFISPNSKPNQNKEKLVYASAPYVSPAHLTQSRAAYPWQAQLQHHQHPPSTPLHQSEPDQRPSTSTFQSMSVSSSSASSLNKQVSQQQGENQLDQHLNSQQSASSSELSKQADRTTAAGARKSPQIMPVVSKPNVKAEYKRPDLSQTIDKLTANTTQTRLIQVCDLMEDPKAKRLNKPRAPPKKSKEARQIVDSETSMSTSSCSPITTAVAVVSNYSKSPMLSDPQSKLEVSKPLTADKLSFVATTSQSSKETKVVKVEGGGKIKKAKKQKQVFTSTQVQTQMTSPLSTVVTASSSVPSMQMPSLAVARTQANALNPQSYILTRPLIMQAYSSPSFAAVPTSLAPIARHAMPLFTGASGLAPVGLQQFQTLSGARFFLATQPQQRPAVIATSGGASTSTIKWSTTASNLTTTRPVTTISSAATARHADHNHNALLSLATTALSTAPIMTSPALSQVGPRVGCPPAIIVSSASHQPTFFAGQQFFRPIIQRFPFGQNFVVAKPGARAATLATATTTSSAAIPGATTVPMTARPGGQVGSGGGQLLFARLSNQSGPRLFITSPSFKQQGFHNVPAQVVTSQAGGQSLTLATLKNQAAGDQAKPLKQKKVTTS